MTPPDPTVTEINALAAEHVCGWVKYTPKRRGEPEEWCEPCGKTKGLTGDVVAYVNRFNPYLDIGDAMELVEKLDDEWDFGVCRDRRTGKKWEVSFEFHETPSCPEEHCYGEALTLPAAITLAALRAVGVEIKEAPDA